MGRRNRRIVMVVSFGVKKKNARKLVVELAKEIAFEFGKENKKVSGREFGFGEEN